MTIIFYGKLHVWYTHCCNTILLLLWRSSTSCKISTISLSFTSLRLSWDKGRPCWVNLQANGLLSLQPFAFCAFIFSRNLASIYFLSHCLSLTSCISFEECMGEGDSCPNYVPCVFPMSFSFYWRWLDKDCSHNWKSFKGLEVCWYCNSWSETFEQSFFIWALSGNKTEHTCAWIMGGSSLEMRGAVGNSCNNLVKERKEETFPPSIK